MLRKMRTPCLLVIGALLLVLTGAATQSEAGVGVPPPPFMFAAPPVVIVIPGTYVYMVPDIDVDFLFFQGYWWRPYEGRWYRSRDYKGGWRYIEPRSIPRGLRALPQDYRHRITPGHERIPHGDVQRNWKKWEKEKHWDRQGKQHGARSEQGSRSQGKQDRGGRGKQDRGGHGGQKGRD